MDFRARATRTCIAHFPEVVMLVTIDDMVSRNVLQPKSVGFLITVKTFLFVTFKDSDIEVFRVKFEYTHEIFPSHIDGAFLEIVTERPVAKHLKHGVVVSIMSHFLQVIMLTAYAKAFLRVGSATWFWVACAENYIFPLVHTSISKHKSRVILDYHRSAWHDSVSFLFKKLFERVTDFVCCHH